MATSIPLVKAFLVDTLLPGLFPDAQITYGLPAASRANDLISVRNARVENTQPVYGTTRPIDEDGTVDVLISCYRPGGEAEQRDATEAAFTIHDALRNHFKSNPNETLGGAVRTAGVLSAELFEDDDPDDIASGRLSQIEVVLGFKARN